MKGLAGSVKKMLSILLLVLILTSTAWAEIREIRSMKEILPSIDRETLVVFDLDNTIMEAAQTLGSDQWFDYLVKKFQQEGMAAGDAVEKAAGMWARVHTVAKVQPVEALTPDLIRKLQANGVTVMGLTARSQGLVERTRTELAGIGVDLDRTPLLGTEHAVLLGGKVIYDRGIVFASGGKKGPILTAIFAEQGLAPHKVVFVDDKAHHTQTVDAALTAASIPNVEFRYGAADPHVQAFDVKLADFEWSFFEKTGRVLNDAEARKMMESPVPAPVPVTA
jgi:phosphoserine phosphatase